MTAVEQLFWRAVTAADFFNIERARRYAPTGGGGQSYISVSFRGLSHEDLGDFLGVSPPLTIRDERPEKTLDVGVVYDPGEHAPLTFSARYRPPQPDDRYRIARQNRQYQQRHPAWTAEYGFPRAPDNVSGPHDALMPDLAYLKVFVAKLADGSYLAGYFNSSVLPPQLAHVADLRRLFEPYDEAHSAGVIRLSGSGIDSADLAGVGRPDERLADQAPEVLEALDGTRVAAGKSPSGQGLRASAFERKAIELRAVAVVTERLESQGWRVEDVGLYRPYDLHGTRGSDVKRVEVKGTTGDGSAVLITPGEVDHARENENVALFVVSGIELAVDEAGGVAAQAGTVTAELDPWVIDDDGRLRPTGYEYRLGGADEGDSEPGA